MATYRVGVIGCGGIARTHTRGFNALKSCEVVAGADIYPESMAKFTEEFGLTAGYTDYHEMLRNESLDIVSVCTWHGTHSEATTAAAENGAKAVLCEKPMATSLAEANRMIEACEQNGTKLVIGHHHRFNARNTHIRQLIQEGAIGQPAALTSRAGGGLLNNGTHAIDRMRYWLGDPETEWVMGQLERQTDRYERGVPIEDRCIGVIAFAGGTRGVIEVDTPGSPPGEMIIFGTEGTLKHTSEGVLLQNGNTQGWELVDVPPDTNQFAELIAWMEGGPEHRGTGKQARCTVEIMMAIYESLRLRQLITMPLENGEYPMAQMIADGTLTVAVEGRYDIRAPQALPAE